jgi:hypothetical protein
MKKYWGIQPRDLLLVLLVLAGVIATDSQPASAIHPCKTAPDTEGCQYIPSTRTGRLIIYESDGMRCSLYINEDGMASGAGGLSCIPWHGATGFRLLRVAKTQDVE